MEAKLSAVEIPAIGELVDEFLASCGTRNLSPESIKLYRIALDRFLIYDICSVDMIDPRLIRKYIFSLQSSGLSPTSVRQYFIILKIFLGFLVEEGFISGNPALLVQAPKSAERIPQVLNENQAQALLDLCPDYSWTGKRDKTAIFLMLGSGIRLSELLSLNLFDVNMESGEVTVMGKGSRQRITSIDDDVTEALKFWIALREKVLAGRPQNALFINRSYGRLGKAFGQTVKQLAAQAGFDCTPHTLRHTHATALLRNGADIKYVKEQLGHSSLTTTEIYLHLANEDLKEVVSKCSITRRLRFDSRQMSLMD